MSDDRERVEAEEDIHIRLKGKVIGEGILVARTRLAELLARIDAQRTVVEAARDLTDGADHHRRLHKCNWCGQTWPCPQHELRIALAALAALDAARGGEGDSDADH